MKKKHYILIAIVLVFLMSLAWLIHDLKSCNKQVLSGDLSSSRKHVAQKILVNCGATVDFFTNVNLKNLQTGSEKTVLSLKGKYTDSCDVLWEGDDTLKINCNRAVDLIYSYANQFDGIKVIYDNPHGCIRCSDEIGNR